MKQNSVLITGGAGFIGCNLANNLLSDGYKVRIFDNLSRKGSEMNLYWLKQNHPKNLEVFIGDVRDPSNLLEAVKGVDTIYHLAGQVAVTSSVEDPRTDFETNAYGTLNVLEAARCSRSQPTVLFTSTNKVYGEMADLAIIEKETRYEFKDLHNGIDEKRELDFHSPYGCSKGSADQYVRDYSRIYDLPTIVFRMSCIYGTRQFGNEDQGWVAHFIISSLVGNKLTIYGNGKQVRDILWIDDLICAFRLATSNITATAGEVFNIGGGRENTISIWREFSELLAELTKKKIEVEYKTWRPGDQPIYVSNTNKFQKLTGWKPFVNKENGIENLFIWVVQNIDLFRK